VLAAMSLRAHPDPARFIERFAGTDATLSDFWSARFWRVSRPICGTFLLRTSIVDWSAESFADALTGGSDGHRMLGRSSIMVCCWLRSTSTESARYHPLFAECCEPSCGHSSGRSSDGPPPGAAMWLRSPFPTMPGRCATPAAGRAWDLAAELSSMLGGLLIDGEMAELWPVLEAMPASGRTRCPELSLAFGAAMLASGKAELAEPYLRAAKDAERLVEPGRASRVSRAALHARRRDRPRG